MTKPQIFVAWLGAALATYDASAIAFPERESNVILYVDDDAPQGGDGSTWQSAFRYLQDALAFAADPNNGVTEIRVAQGTYKPDQGAGHTPGNREETFQIPPAIALRGGYAGLAGNDPDARNWNEYESICSGDLTGNDPPQGTLPSAWLATQFSDNSRHVVSLVNPNSVVLEGLIIQSGYHNPGFDDVGTGVACNGGSLEVLFCTIRGNWGFYGGGAGTRNCNIAIRSTSFQHNRGTFGGGLDARNGNILIEECTFFENRVQSIGVGAGAIVVDGLVRESTFLQNIAAQGAADGALSFSSGSVAEDCHFIANIGDEHGAASGGQFLRCTFVGNSAYLGGAVRASAGTFIDCDFDHNLAHDRGGAAYTTDTVQVSSGLFSRCLFTENTALNLSGGAVDAGTTCVNCSFRGNDCWEDGGGAIRAKQNTTLINCVLDSNTTLEDGGAIRVLPGKQLTLINTTVVNNASQQGISGVAIEGTAAIHNSIVWGNGSAQVTGSATVTYSCVQDGWNGPGNSNISDDPLFRNMLGPDGTAGTDDDDLRLSPASPCVDAGDNSVMPQDTFDLDQDGDTTELVPLDLLEQRRFRNDPETLNTGNAGGTGLPIVDIGAFEFQPLADINADGIVNVNDLLAVINAWGPCPQSQRCVADIAPYPHGNGLVDFHDLLKVVFAWGQ